jgi:hypothetical protein
MLARCFAVLAALVAVLLVMPSTAVAVPSPRSLSVPSAAITSSGYPWAQPLAAAVAVPYGQPPASISIATILSLPASTAYAWAQPGSVTAPLLHAQPPAGVVSASSCSVH